MPPAFNLSQDQTLQFVLLQVNSFQRWPHPPVLPPENKTFGLPPSAFTEQAAGLTALCEHFVCLGFSPQHLPTLADKSAPGPQTTSTHTYRLQIFKEQADTSPGSVEFMGKVQQRGAIIVREETGRQHPCSHETHRWGRRRPEQVASCCFHADSITIGQHRGRHSRRPRPIF